MPPLGPLRAAFQAVRRHPAVLLPAVGLALGFAPARIALFVGAGEAVSATTNTLRALGFLLTPYFLGLVVAGGVRALDAEGPTLRTAFAPRSRYGTLLGSGLLVGGVLLLGFLLVGLSLRAVGVVGLILLVAPLAVLVATQFYPVFVVHDDAGILGGIAASISLFELYPGRVLRFSVVAVVLWGLPGLLVLLAWSGLTTGLPGLGGSLGAEPMAARPAVLLALLWVVLRAGTVALRWTYAVAFCRELA